MVVTTGIGGTISLCQATFAAIGAFATAQLVTNFGMSVLVAMLIGAVIAAAVGAVLACRSSAWPASTRRWPRSPSP